MPTVECQVILCPDAADGPTSRPSGASLQSGPGSLQFRPHQEDRPRSAAAGSVPRPGGEVESEDETNPLIGVATCMMTYAFECAANAKSS
jgi:hypothetical protein